MTNSASPFEGRQEEIAAALSQAAKAGIAKADEVQLEAAITAAAHDDPQGRGGWFFSNIGRRLHSHHRGYKLVVFPMDDPFLSTGVFWSTGPLFCPPGPCFVHRDLVLSTGPPVAKKNDHWSFQVKPPSPVEYH